MTIYARKGSLSTKLAETRLLAKTPSPISWKMWMEHKHRMMRPGFAG